MFLSLPISPHRRIEAMNVLATALVVPIVILVFSIAIATVTTVQPIPLPLNTIWTGSNYRW